MAAHGMKRARPAELVAGTLSVITARLDYLPRTTAPGWQAIEWRRLADPAAAAVSIYARGRDYHKVLRQRLRRLADQLAEAIGPFGHRVFTDSAPVLEVELAARSGIGWRGKHTLALDRDAGSMFFLGEIFVDVALPESAGRVRPLRQLQRVHRRLPDAGDRRALRARRAPLHLVPDDRGARARSRSSSAPRSATASTAATTASSSAPGTSSRARARSPTSTSARRSTRRSCSTLWAWREDDFLRETEGSAIRRIGFERWQRNLAVALGNALAASGDPAIVAALKARREERERARARAHRLGAAAGRAGRARRAAGMNFACSHGHWRIDDPHPARARARVAAARPRASPPPHRAPASASARRASASSRRSARRRRSSSRRRAARAPGRSTATASRPARCAATASSSSSAASA